MPLLVALPALPEVAAAALVAMILAYAATTLFRPYLDAFLRMLPLVGKMAADAVDKLISKVDETESNWWDSAISPMIGLVYSAPRKLELWMNNVEDTLRKCGNQLANLSQAAAEASGISGLVTTVQTVVQRLDKDAAAIQSLQNQPYVSTDDVTRIAKDEAHTAYQNSLDAVHTGVQNAETYAKQQADTAAALARAAQQSTNTLAVQVGKIAQSLSSLVQQVGDLSPSVVDSELEHTLNGAEAYADKLRQAVETEITGAVKTSDQYAHQLVTTLDTAVNKALERVDHGIANTRDTLEGKIGAVAAAEQITAHTLAKVETTVAKMKADCVDPMCEWLGPQVKAQKTLNGILGDAGLIGLLIAAVADPSAAAKAASDVVGPLAGELNGVVRELVGVRG